jgi:hypothetical protein
MKPHFHFVEIMSMLPEDGFIMKIRENLSIAVIGAWLIASISLLHLVRMILVCAK